MSISGKRILIIGGGFSGMSAAIALRKHGAEIDLVEIDHRQDALRRFVRIGIGQKRA